VGFPGNVLIFPDYSRSVFLFFFFWRRPRSSGITFYARLLLSSLASTSPVNLLQLDPGVPLTEEWFGGGSVPRLPGMIVPLCQTRDLRVASRSHSVGKGDLFPRTPAFFLRRFCSFLFRLPSPLRIGAPRNSCDPPPFYGECERGSHSVPL